MGISHDRHKVIDYVAAVREPHASRVREQRDEPVTRLLLGLLSAVALRDRNHFLDLLTGDQRRHPADDAPNRRWESDLEQLSSTAAPSFATRCSVATRSDAIAPRRRSRPTSPRVWESSSALCTTSGRTATWSAQTPPSTPPRSAPTDTSARSSNSCGLPSRSVPAARSNSNGHGVLPAADAHDAVLRLRTSIDSCRCSAIVDLEPSGGARGLQ